MIPLLRLLTRKQWRRDHWSDCHCLYRQCLQNKQLNMAINKETQMLQYLFRFHRDTTYRKVDTNNWMIEKIQKTLDRLSRSRLRLGCSKPDKYTRHARKQTIMTPTAVVRNSQGKVRLEILYPHVGQLFNTISTLGAKGGQVGEHNRSSKMRWRLEYNPCNVWKQNADEVDFTWRVVPASNSSSNSPKPPQAVHKHPTVWTKKDNIETDLSRCTIEIVGRFHPDARGM